MESWKAHRTPREFDARRSKSPIATIGRRKCPSHRSMKPEESSFSIQEEDDMVSEAFVAAPVKTLVEVLKDSESFTPWQDRVKKFPMTKVEYGTFTYRASAQARAAFWSMAITLLLGFAITQTSNLTTNKNRRRKKTELCVKACLAIVSDALKDVDFIMNRALTSEDGPRAPRKTRKYKTRK